MAATPQHLHSRGFQALIGSEQWNALFTQGKQRAYAAANRLLDQGAHSSVVYVLHQGRVRVVYTEPDGNEALIAIRGPGDLIGEYAQRDNGVHMASVWTLEPCTASLLTSARFEGFVRRHQLDDTLQHYMLSKARQAAQRIWRASNLQTEQRMAQLFLEIINADPFQVEPSIPMTQQQVADSLGVARSSVTRLLAHWRESGLVRIQPARMSVADSAALARRGSRT
jgi:CRP/FNR family transcriptional regulator, cyclic AMP receptor protein